MSQSNYVRIWIEVGARRYPLAQAAPDWVELAGEDTPPAGAAVVVTESEGRTYRDDVVLGQPADDSSRIVAIEAARSAGAA